MIKISGVIALLTMTLSASAQHKPNVIPDKYTGDWNGLNLDSSYRYQVRIQSDSIYITPKGEKAHSYVLRSKKGTPWFWYSKTEKIELALTNENNTLWLNYVSKEEYPIQVPLITVIRYKRVK